MAMKVIGTGAPRMLTVRFRPCEVGVVLDELHHQRAAVTEAAAHGHEQSDAPGAGAGDPEVEDHHDELFLITRLLDDLQAPTPAGRFACGHGTDVRARASDPRRRRGSPRAFVQCVREFAADKGAGTAEELRLAVDTAAALTGTLIGLDHAENHGVDA
jgi:hypothetical protein